MKVNVDDVTFDVYGGIPGFPRSKWEFPLCVVVKYFLGEIDKYTLATNDINTCVKQFKFIN